MKEKVEAEWHPTDKSHSRTDDDWKRIMAEPYVTKTEEEEKKKGEEGDGTMRKEEIKLTAPNGVFKFNTPIEP